MTRPKQAAWVAAALVLVGAGAWFGFGRGDGDHAIVLYGNVDLRQVSLAFNANERVAEMRVEEGEHVTKGQVLAVLDTTTLKLRVAQAQAQLTVLEEALRRLEAGSRPEEIAQARAHLAGAEAEALRARTLFERLQSVSTETRGRAVSRQELDAARAAFDVAQSRAVTAKEAQTLAVTGPRAEDIAQARAQRDASAAALAVLQQQLTDSELVAPVDAVVRSRLLEPGDMASPQRPAYALALMRPKWVRAYVSETDLGRVQPGDTAEVAIDSAPDRPLAGHVGYIASVAEFTPKTVQTEDLRTSLVYEIRINVDDPDNRLRLGMPATVRLGR
ncbi:MAG: HlyD family efflux transporter periplasmic adaptor subunit [Steroidobacteraceae bacterium]